MRNPDRLDKFYEELWSLHKIYFPDLRFCQLYANFFEWLTTIKGKDYFYMEEGQTLAYLKEYIMEMKG